MADSGAICLCGSRRDARDPTGDAPDERAVAGSVAAEHADHADHAELKFLRSGTAGCAGASARPAGPRILRTFASSVAEARHRREHLPPSAADLVFGARVLLSEGQ